MKEPKHSFYLAGRYSRRERYWQIAEDIEARCPAWRSGARWHYVNALGNGFFRVYPGFSELRGTLFLSRRALLLTTSCGGIGKGYAG